MGDCLEIREGERELGAAGTAAVNGLLHIAGDLLWHVLVAGVLHACSPLRPSPGPYRTAEEACFAAWAVSCGIDVEPTGERNEMQSSVVVCVPIRG